MKFSTEISAIILAVGTPMLANFLSEGCAAEVAAYIPTVAAGAYLWIKRVARGGVSPLGVRK